MNSRRINKQQSNRIAKKQASYQEAHRTKEENLHDGLVIQRFGHHATIEAQDQSRFHCSLRPNLGSLVAGDRVVWRQEGERQGVVISRYPRETVLCRVNARNEEKPVAANLTQVIIVIAPEPLVSWTLLDSYLILSELAGLKASIILNKTDLPSEDLQTTLQKVYAQLGYPIIFLDNYLKRGKSTLTQATSNETSVFVGQSGVGKSSIISGLLPDIDDIAIQSISKAKAHGRHTTTNATYYHLPNGGALIDSPGIRTLMLPHENSMRLAQGYRDFLPYLPHCQFRNCNHINDQGCAIIDAVKEKKISPQRYEQFVKISTQIG